MARRGWTVADIHETLALPRAIRRATNRATGNEATAYFRADGTYIVVDDQTGGVIQISDRNNPEWKPDTSIQDPPTPQDD